MKLEYLTAQPGNMWVGPFIRLYSFSAEDVAKLHSVFVSLASGERQTVALHEQPWIEQVRGCCLTLHFGRKDRGVLEIAGPAVFECTYTDEGWAELADKTQLFLHDQRPGRFQYLTMEGEVGLLLSPDGGW